MTGSNFINPLTIVQTISMYSCLNTLSDFLYTEKFLAENNQNRRIPIINSLSDYLRENNGNEEKILNLARKLLNGTDLYGENENEIPDIHFVNTMFDQIMKHVVYEKYSNVYGLLAGASRYFGNMSYVNLIQLMHTHLKSEFENEYGPPSKLSFFLKLKLGYDSWFSLFPLIEENREFISIDYMFAEAGFMFIRSGEIKSADYFADPPPLKELQRKANLSSESFDEYVALGQVIGHLVITGKLDKSALRVFALPAIFHYVFIEEENLRGEHIVNIINDPKHWTKAFEILFSYLDASFKKVRKAWDPSYQFLSKLTKFKNRKTLARENLRRRCSSMTKNDLRDAVKKYMNDSINYRCKGNIAISVNINDSFNEQNNNIANKYYVLEKELLEKAFRSLNSSNVLIRRERLLPSQEKINQELKLSNDLLQISDLNTNQTYLYALIRDNFNLTLIKEDDDPELFAQKLDFRPQKQPPQFWLTENLTMTHELIETIAKESSEELRENLHSVGYDGQVTDLVAHLKKLLPPMIEKKDSVTKVVDFSQLVKQYVLNDLKIDIYSLIEPGLGLVADIGGAGIKAVEKMIDLAGEMSKVNFESTKRMLESTRHILKNSIRKISEKDGRNVYIRTLSNNTSSGYGYKFIYTSHGLAVDLRKVYEMDHEVPVVFHGVTEDNVKIYKAMDPITGVVVNDYDLHVTNDEVEDGFFELEHFDDYAESSEELDACQTLRHKRSPTPGPSGCKRIQDLSERMILEDSAINSEYQKLNVEKEAIRLELRKYVFPEDGSFLEKKFVQDLKTEKSIERRLSAPSWSESYRIDEPELFFTLRYKEVLGIEDFNHLTESEVFRRIKNLRKGTKFPIPLMDEEKVLKLWSFYKKRPKLNSDLIFEDFHALHAYHHFPPSELESNMDVARQLRMAIYKLSIRQSHGDFAVLPKKLIRFERRPSSFIDTLESGKEFTLARLTPTARKWEDVWKIYSRARSNYPEKWKRICYEFNFEQWYPRASLEDIGIESLKDIILLPGTKFRIEWTAEIKDLKMPHKKVGLTLLPLEKHEMQQITMRKIHELKQSDTKFYYDDPVENLLWGTHPSSTESSQFIGFEALSRRNKAENEAVKFAMRKTKKIEEKEIRQELRKYVFPDGGKEEMKFVKNWIKDSEGGVPEYFEKFRIDEPELFFTLKHQKTLEDVEHLTETVAKRKIESVKKEFISIKDVEKLRERYLSPETMLYEHFDFKDYFILQKFDYTHMNTNPDILSQMALYKSAIRRSEYAGNKVSPGKMFETTQIMSNRKFQDLRGKREFELDRFFHVIESGKPSSSMEKTYIQIPIGERVTVYYQIEFKESFFGVDLENILKSRKEPFFIVPGTKFHIEHVAELAPEYFKPCYKITMTCSSEKLEWQQKIMGRIKKLKDSSKESSILDSFQDPIEKFKTPAQSRLDRFASRVRSFFSKETSVEDRQKLLSSANRN